MNNAIVVYDKPFYLFNLKQNEGDNNQKFMTNVEE